MPRMLAYPRDQLRSSMAARAVGMRGWRKMTWAIPDSHHVDQNAACAFCGKRTPGDLAELRNAGWQVRSDYPIKFRCPSCRQRQTRGVAAA